jgi:hypothetical protein
VFERIAAVQIEKSMEKLQQIYAVYEEHCKNVESFSIVLWADLEISKIMEVADGVASKLRSLKHLSEVPVYDLVSKDISGFMSSLPLMKVLKGDALRKRHWDALMKVCTEARFDKLRVCHLMNILRKIGLSSVTALSNKERQYDAGHWQGLRHGSQNVHTWQHVCYAS